MSFFSKIGFGVLIISTGIWLNSSVDFTFSNIFPLLNHSNTVVVEESIQSMPLSCSSNSPSIRFTHCFDETDATPDTDRNDYFVCCAPPTWMPSEAYEFDAPSVEEDWPCTAGANIDSVKLTITIQSVTLDWSNFPCCADYLEGLYANLYDNCTAPTCTVLGDGLVNNTPGEGDCAASGDHLVFDTPTQTFPLGLPYTSETFCLGNYFDTFESLGVDIVPSFRFDEANNNGCNCPTDAISQGVVQVEYDIKIEYVFCEDDLPPNCAQVSFGSIGPLCENDGPFTLPISSNEGYTGTWTPATINPSGLGGTTVSAKFTPDANQGCLPEVFIDVDIDSYVNPPTFNQLGPFCETESLIALPTTSNEGVNGTWDVGPFFDPSLYGGQSVTISFTPDFGECSNTTTMTISVLEETTPTFISFSPICENEPPVSLSSVSLEGITGNWDIGSSFNPFGLGGQTVTINFFADPGQCAPMVTALDIEVLDEVTPTFVQIADLCENDPIVFFPTTSVEGIQGNWDPSSINPSGQGGNSITATFTPNFGECAASTTMTVNINEADVPAFSGLTPICENDGLLILPTISDNGIQGSWDPPSVDPNGQGGNSILATFTPNSNECAISHTLNININSATDPTFFQIGPLCESDGLVFFPNISNEGIMGSWNPSSINPMGNGGNTITATFTPNATECANQTTMDVQINAETLPTFNQIGPLCELDAPVSLEDLSLEGITGSWDVGNTFDPNGQGGQSVTIFFTSDGGQCAQNTSMTIIVDATSTPIFDPLGPLCEDDPSITLPGTSNNGITGVWDIGNTFDPTGLGGTTTTINFTPDNGQCAENTSENIIVNTIPLMTESEKACNGSLMDYFVTIETDGTNVTSTDGTVTFNPDGTFTIDGIPEGTNPTLTITNLSTGCDESFTIDSPVCSCPPINPPIGSNATICENEIIPMLAATPQGNFEIDWYDQPTGGNLLQQNNFFYTPSGAGTFYAEAIDTSSNCVSIERTEITLTIIQLDTCFETAMTCDPMLVGIDTVFYSTAECDSVVITTTSLAPNNEEFFSNTSCDPNDAGTDTLFLTNQFGCDSLIITETLFSAADTTINPIQNTCNPIEAGIDTTIFQTALCDSVVITETVLLQSNEIFLSDFTCDPNMAGTDTLVFTNQFGCDSTVITTLDLAPSESFLFQTTSCDILDVGTDTSFFNNQFGCDSLVILETTFAEADTTYFADFTCDINQVGSDTTIFTTSDCDSLVITTLTLAPESETFFNEASCNMNEVGMDTVFLNNQFGCDSLVITSTTFSPPDTTFATDMTCDLNQVGIDTLYFPGPDCDSIVVLTTSLSPPEETIVNDMTCDLNQVGIDTLVLSNQSGCDSLVITVTSLAPSDQEFVNASSCNPNDVGVDTLFLSNQFGCDSLIITATSLLPADETFDNALTCDPNEVGIDTTYLVNQNGCDSLIITSTTLAPGDMDFQNATTCDPNQVGQDTLVLNNQFGCDSLIITTTILVPENETFLTDTSCDPGQIGQDTTFLSNQFGCDSLVITTTTLLPSDETLLNAITCEVSEVGMDTIILFNMNGCDSLVITETTLAPEISSIDISFEAPTCIGGLGMIEILAINGGSAPFLYSIDGGNTFGTVALFNELEEGVYDIVIQDLEGCNYSEAIELPAPIQPVVALDSEVTIQLGEFQILNALTNIPENDLASIQWTPALGLSCTDCLTPTATPTETTTYTIIIADSSGCTAMASIEIFVQFNETVYIPNVFSPNGDGVNDSFYVYGDEKQIGLIRVFQVYSRWGELMFEAENLEPNSPTTGWKGFFNGEKMNAGVYMYKAQVVFTNGRIEEYIGDVTLVR